jgi:ribosome-associated heat shock protein Hsp15
MVSNFAAIKSAKSVKSVKSASQMTPQKVRVDKWLWSVRLFKTRTIATDACKAGRVKIGGKTLKPSHIVQLNDTLSVKKESFNLTFKVLGLIEKRVAAPVAQACYENLTPPEEMNKFKDWFIETRDRGTGRPTKRERRDIDDYKDGDDEARFDFLEEGE